MLGYEPIGHIASDFRTAGPQRFDKTALHCWGNLAKVIGGLGLRGLAFGLGGGIQDAFDPSGRLLAAIAGRWRGLVDAILLAFWAF